MHSLLVLITQELASIRQQLGPESELLLQGVSYKQESGIDILGPIETLAIVKYRSPKTSPVATPILIQVDKRHPVV